MYLQLLPEYTCRHAVEVLAYCLMTNHIHLVVVPENSQGLHRGIARDFIERNPVRAGLVGRAECYPWSSAGAHCGILTDPVLTESTVWRDRLRAIGDWSDWLDGGDEQESLELLRQNADKGLPCGLASFVERLGRAAGRALRNRPRGRPKRGSAEKG